MNDGMDGFAYYRLASIFTEIQLDKYLISAHVCRVACCCNMEGREATVMPVVDAQNVITV